MAIDVSLFCRSPVRMQSLQYSLVEPVGDRLKVPCNCSERVRPLQATLVHVQRTVDLELNRMQAGGRIAIVLGDETSRIGLVAAYRIAPFPERHLDGVRNSAQAAGAVTIADHDVGP